MLGLGDSSGDCDHIHFHSQQFSFTEQATGFPREFCLAGLWVAPFGIIKSLSIPLRGYTLCAMMILRVALVLVTTLKVKHCLGITGISSRKYKL